jgi:hypothetical protein
MNQAIITKFLGPTYTKSARIKAAAFGGSLIRPYKSELSEEDNHLLVAYELAVGKLKWENWLKMSAINSGRLPCGNVAHVVR